MNELIRWFFIIAGVLFLVTAFVLLVFPVEVYERAKESFSEKEGIKGLFAQTVISMYFIKRDHLDAEPKYWWHVIWFNTVAAVGVSIGITTGLFVILGIVAVVISAIIAVVILGVILAVLGGE